MNVLFFFIPTFFPPVKAFPPCQPFSHSDSTFFAWTKYNRMSYSLFFYLGAFLVTEILKRSILDLGFHLLWALCIKNFNLKEKGDVWSFGLSFLVISLDYKFSHKDDVFYSSDPVIWKLSSLTNNFTPCLCVISEVRLHAN